MANVNVPEGKKTCVSKLVARPVVFIFYVPIARELANNVPPPSPCYCLWKAMLKVSDFPNFLECLESLETRL